jgi:hypothetical protein
MHIAGGGCCEGPSSTATTAREERMVGKYIPWRREEEPADDG